MTYKNEDNTIEVLLHRYLDGECTPTERAEIERDPQLVDRVAELRRFDARLRELFTAKAGEIDDRPSPDELIAYVDGTLDEQQRLLVAQRAAQDPEVQEEIELLQRLGDDPLLSPSMPQAPAGQAVARQTHTAQQPVPTQAPTQRGRPALADWFARAMVVLLILAPVLFCLIVVIPRLGRGGGAASGPTAAPASGPLATAAPASAPTFPPASAPTAAAGPTAAPTAPIALPEPAGQLVYTDDFGGDPETEKQKSGLENQLTASDFSRGFDSGVYNFLLARPNETHWRVLPRFAYRDFTVQIELWDNSSAVGDVGGASAGVVFRVRDDDHFYTLLIDSRSGRYTVRKREANDQWIEIIPWKPSPLVKQGKEHNLVRIGAVGDTFTIYLNNTLLDRFRDDSYPSGMLGMIVDNTDAVTTHIRFDNLMVWSADTPATSAALPSRPDMVAIGGGEFVMGSYERDDEQPPHIVAVKPFYIDLSEVTNAAYEQCAIAGMCQRPADPGSSSHPSYYTNQEYADYPVINVSWEQARDYCGWAGKHLPTEAEWEKAASWNAAIGLKMIWPWEGGFDAARLNTDARTGDTTAVKQFPSELNGTFDMAGNVWEWTSSLYKPYPYRADDGREDPKASGERVLRGGSWKESNGARAAFRNHAAQTHRDNQIGFRCAASP